MDGLIWKEGRKELRGRKKKGCGGEEGGVEERGDWSGLVL